MLRDVTALRQRSVARHGLVTTLLVAALVLAGCGSDESEPAEDGSDADETDPEDETDSEDDASEDDADGETAADFPEDRITYIVPYGAGGGTDVLGRQMAPMLEEELGEAVVVENQPGGQTIPALNNVLGDSSGHTLIFEGALIAGLSARDIEDIGPDDFTPIAIPQADPMALTVRADAPWETMEEFAEAAEEEPDSLQVATSAAGGVNHAAMTLLQDAGLPIDVVPFSEGEADAINAFLAGDVDAVSVPPQGVVDHVEAGDARILGVGNEERLESLPDVPTFAEAGFEGPTVKAFRVVLGPPDLPDEALSVLESAFTSVMEDEDFHEFLEENTYQYAGLGPDGSAEFLDEQVELYHSIYAEG